MSKIETWIEGTGRQPDELLLRVIEEEMEELKEAIWEFKRAPGLTYTQEDLLKEMCDVIFTIKVWCSSNYWLLESAFDEVCDSNLSKLDGVEVREDGKILKGPNYQPANMYPYI